MAESASAGVRIDEQVRSDARPPAPNAETLEAIREGEEIIKSGKTRFDSADEMLLELKSQYYHQPTEIRLRVRCCSCLQSIKT